MFLEDVFIIFKDDPIYESKFYEIEKPFIPTGHIKFKKGNHDIALVKTVDKILFNEYIEAIPLPKINPLWCKEFTFQIAGWGYKEIVRSNHA